MQLSKNFTLKELTVTSKCADNTPTSDAIEHLKDLCQNCLQPIRDFYGKPIKINSGYRSEQVNKLVGGSKTSAHRAGYAADTKPCNCNMKEYQKKVLEWAKTHTFDQIIIEYPINYVAQWIHIGVKNCQGKQRRQILYTLNGKQYCNITRKFYLS